MAKAGVQVMDGDGFRFASASGRYDVPGNWGGAADFSTLERVKSSYVADQDRQRHDDRVWRFRIGEQTPADLSH